jgi:hypothetical protein
MILLTSGSGYYSFMSYLFMWLILNVAVVHAKNLRLRRAMAQCLLFQVFIVVVQGNLQGISSPRERSTPPRL